MLQNQKSVLKKPKKYLSFLIIIVGLVMTLTTVFSSQGPTLFYIGGYGEVVGQFPVRDGLVDYSVTFDNPTNRSFKIYTIEPILTEKAKSILLDNIVPLEEIKKLDSEERVEYSGHFRVNTSELTEAEIQKLIPLIKGYKVIFNQHEEIILPIPNRDQNEKLS